MVAVESAWNYACLLQNNNSNNRKKPKINNVIVNVLKNYNLLSSLLLSNSRPVLAWHYIFPYVATSLSMPNHYGRDSPTHLILTTVFLSTFDLEVTVILIAQMGS